MSILRLLITLYVSFVQRKESDFLITCTGEPAFPQPGHETAEGREAPRESLDVLDIPDLVYFNNG
jgi:hypothetical protein